MSLLGIAQRRRAKATVDSLASAPAPIQVMNTFQVKGRQVDVSLIVREPSDREPHGAVEEKRFGRLVYVSVARARQRVGFILPADVHGYFAPIAQLARQD